MGKISKPKKRFFMALIMVCAIAIATIVSVAAIFAADLQGVDAGVEIKYVIDGVGVKISASYATVSSDSASSKTAIKTSDGKSELEFKVSDENANLDSVSMKSASVTLNQTTTKVVYEYKFTNMADSAFTIDLTNESSFSTTNKNIRYRVSPTEIAASNYTKAFTDTSLMKQAVVEKGRTIYIYVSAEIIDSSSSSAFAGEFVWKLSLVEDENLYTINLNNQGSTGGQSTIKIIPGNDVAMPIIYNIPPMPASKTHAFGGYFTQAEGLGTIYTKSNGTSAHVADLANGSTLYACFESPFIYQSGSTTVITGLTGYGLNAETLNIPDGTTSISGIVSTNVTVINIPNSVTTIQDNTFSGCTNLQQVNFVDSTEGLDYASSTSQLRTIGANAFKGCTSLKELILPEGVTSIGAGALQNLSSLEHLVIPSTVTSLPGIDTENAPLQGTNNLKTLECSADVIPSGNPPYGYSGFDCLYGYHDDNWNWIGERMPSSLTKIILNGGTSIRDGAFYTEYHSISLTSIEIPSSVTSIGEWAFAYCGSLTSIEIPSSVTSIGDNAFQYCSSLTKVEIPSSVISIGNEAFSWCISLTSVTFGENSQLTSIGSYAFAYCSSLASIEIPSSVTSFGTTPLSGCTALETLEFPYIIGAGTGNTQASSALYTKLFGSAISTLKTVKINGGTSIGNYAFAGWTGITTITIPSTVTTIGTYAFYNTLGLTTLNYNATTVTDLAGSNYAFAYAGQTNGLTVNVGANVTKIPAYLFYPYANSTYYPKVTTLKFASGSNCATIGTYAFYYCDDLTEINLPASVVSVGAYAFRYCTAATKLEMAGGINTCTIGNYAFGNCTGLTSAKFSSNVSSFGTYPLYNCTALVTLEFPYVIGAGTSTSGISYSALYTKIFGANITTLKTINVNGGTAISNYAFKNWTSVTTLTIPSTVTSIGTYSFQSMTGLTTVNYNATACADVSSSAYPFYYGGNTNGMTVNIGANVTKIPAYLFYYSSASYAPKIKTLNFANGSVCTSIGASAFYYCDDLTAINLPNSVTTIGASAFYNCTAATSITIPNSVTTINSSAFYGCSKATSITIGEGVTSIGTSAFYNATALTSLNYNAKNCADQTSTTNSIFYLAGSANGLTLTIGANVTKIPAYMFYSHTTTSYIPNIKTLTFASGSKCTSIGAYAFYYSDALTAINLPDSVTTIGMYAFYYCSAATTLTIGKGVTSIGTYAFYCTNNLATINYNAANCADLASGNRVFYYSGQTSGAITVNIGASVEKIPAYIFFPYSGTSYRPRITNVDFADNSVCSSIGTYAFGYCSSLTSCELPDSLYRVDPYAFISCSSVTFAPATTTATWYRASTATASSGTNFTMTAANAKTQFVSSYSSYYFFRACDHTFSNLYCTKCGTYIYSTTNGANYYFAESPKGTFSANGIGVNSSSSTTTITFNTTVTVVLDYSIISETNYDKFTMTTVISGTSTTRANAISSSSGLSNSYTLTFNAGDTISLTYSKDSSSHATGEKAVVTITVQSGGGIVTAEASYTNSGTSNVYIPTTRGTKFSFGAAVYETTGEYIMVQPGQTVTVGAEDFEDNIQTSKPADLSTKLFFAAYGEYPQTYVGDTLNETLKSASLTATGKSYTTDVYGTATTLTEYSYNGAKYAKLTSSKTYATDYVFKDGTTVASSQTYFFKVEPIVAKAMEINGDKATMMTVEMMGTRAFDDNANNWETSTIRTYLNNTFLTESGLNAVAQSTTITNEDPFNTSSYDGDTTDKIWLASAREILDWTGSGDSYSSFVSNGSLNDSNDSKRKIRPSDMAMATYCYYNKTNDAGLYFLRSAGYDYHYVCCVINYGYVYCAHDYYDFDDVGFCPVFNVSLGVSTVSTITNNASENAYIAVASGTTFSFGEAEYTTAGEYIMVQPGQTVVVNAEVASSAISKTQPADLSTKLFFAAYGEYPQTYVGDTLNTTLKSASLTATGKTYTTDINGTATTLTEYLYNGAKYAKLTSSNAYDSSNYVFKDGTTVTDSQTYFFKVEPIVAKAMEINDDKATMMTVEIMGSRAFDDNANNWETSTMRTYLNNTFLTESGLNAVAQSTTITNEDEWGTSSYDGDTTDKIWLASAREICEWSGSDYDEFVSECLDIGYLSDSNNSKRKIRPSDMAMATYCYYYKTNDAGIYFLRSAGYSNNCVCDVYIYGDVYGGYHHYDSHSLGFCPVFAINL